MRVAESLLSAVLLGVLSMAGSALPAAAQEEDLEPVDRILAVVDDDPILASDVDQIVALGTVERGEEEGEAGYRRRVLDLLIEQKLRFHEIDRFGFTEIPLDEVERQVEAVRARFATEGEFRERLEEVGLDEQGLRQLLAQQLMVLIYVEERLGPRIFVGLDDIRQYYDETFAPELARRGEKVPPIQEVREEIRRVLKEQRLNEEIVLWTEELRREADVADYFDSRHEGLPPVVVE